MHLRHLPPEMDASKVAQIDGLLDRATSEHGVHIPLAKPTHLKGIARRFRPHIHSSTLSKFFHPNRMIETSMDTSVTASSSTPAIAPQIRLYSL